MNIAVHGRASYSPTMLGELAKRLEIFIQARVYFQDSCHSIYANTILLISS